jgi:hypothetical protein
LTLLGPLKRLYVGQVFVTARGAFVPFEVVLGDKTNAQPIHLNDSFSGITISKLHTVNAGQQVNAPGIQPGLS